MGTEGHYGVCGELLRKYDDIHRLEDRQTSSPSLTLSRHPQEIGGAVDQHNVLSILLRYGALFDAVNICDGKSAWAYRYTRTRTRPVARLASMVSMGTATVAFAGKELADRHVAEEMEMSSGMGAPI
jgi:hypothetical protein